MMPSDRSLCWSFNVPLFGFFRVLAACLALAPGLPAASYLWNPSKPAPTPAWIAATQNAPGVMLDTWECRLLPPQGLLKGQSLAVVLYYQDGGSGVLRALWSGPSEEVILGDRLLEGAAMPNRRTLVIRAEEIEAGGTLAIQEDAGSGRFLRAKLHWVAPATLLAGNASGVPGLHLDGHYASVEEIQGAPPPLLGDAAQGRVSAAILQEAPIALAEDPAFAVEFSEIPRRVLVECEAGNLPPDAPLHLWINDTLVAAFQVELPDLWDDGWMEVGSASSPSGTAAVYAGWRKARAWVDPAYLAAGGSLLQVHAPGAATGPVLRRLRIQAAFAPVPRPEEAGQP